MNQIESNKIMCSNNNYSCGNVSAKTRLGPAQPPPTKIRPGSIGHDTYSQLRFPPLEKTGKVI